MHGIPVGAQIFDIAFHTSSPVVFVGLLTGEIKAFRYDEEGKSDEVFTARPSKRSCRGISTSEDGSKLFTVGKGKAMYTIDTASGKTLDSRLDIHQAPINRIKRLSVNLLCTGDDNGVVKLWDSRKRDALRTYNHHFDFISDFMLIENKHQVVMTSGDGSLSVIDIRSSKTVPLAHSEDQEDELLSVIPIRRGEKTVVGTQLGFLHIFNRSSGWGDCVDRIPGHPHSIDALCSLPPSYPSSHSTILTGSSDGLLRAVQLFPTKLLGVVADHGEFPIERIAIDMDGEGHWVGSVGHDEVLRMTDLREILEDENAEDEEAGASVAASDRDGDGTDEEMENSSEEESVDCQGTGKPTENDVEQPENDELESGDESDSSSEEQVVKRKRKMRTDDPLATDRKKKRRPKMDEVIADPSFFADL